MNKITLGAQFLLGLLYFVFGLNGFLNFIPTPPDMPEKVMNFSGALAATGYFFPFLKASEVIAGLMILSGFYVPVALLILAPITIQIILFHGFLTPGLSNSIMPITIAMLLGLSAKRHWSLYRGLFKRGY